MEEWKENGGGGGKRKVEGEKEWKVKGRGREMEKGRERKKGGRGIIKGNGKGKEDSLRNVGCTDARTDTQVILYSDQCYALHWTDKNLTSPSALDKEYTQCFNKKALFFLSFISVVS